MKANKKTAKTAASKTPAPESKQPKGKKLLLFKTLAILTPFIILILLQVGVGHVSESIDIPVL